MSYLSDAPSKRKTPQSEAIPGRPEMVANRAGGYVFAVDEWTRLERFLILGTEGGTYYAGQRELTKFSADAVRDCLKADPARTIATIVVISDEGRAPRNTEALFALALIAAENPGTSTRQLALEAMPQIARTATHLFQFIGFYEQMGGGWGRMFKRYVTRWYTDKPLGKVAFQMVKYREREGWSHADVLRLAKPRPKRDSGWDKLYRWAVGKTDFDEVPPASEDLRIVEGFERAKRAGSAREVVELVRDFRLPREAIPTEYLPTVEVQAALLESMPMTAMIRNLANMTRSGLLSPTSEATRKVLDELGDEERIAKARIHPFNVLLALKTYESGHGLRGGNNWNPIPQIVDALDSAFYAAFRNVVPTGKRFLIGLDVSGSMYTSVAGVPNFSAREAAAAMALMIAKTEKAYEVVAFTGGHTGYGYHRQGPQGPDMVSAFPISAKQRLDDVVSQTQGLSFGGTDCALPMLYALANEREVDAFVTLTDNESWAGDLHASQALAQYRQESGIDAKMVAMAFAANEYSVADPDDGGMMDVVGLDAAGPQLALDFVR